MTTAERRARFRDLHAGNRLFVMPNPWDVGSARLLEAAGFEALATTSAGYAWSLGRLDQTVTREELVAHVGALTEATTLPLNVDSERLYPDEPGGVAETVRLLAGAGAAGCSVEDWDPAAGRIDDVGVAAERVAAAAEAAHGLAEPMVLTDSPRTTFTASTTSTTRSRACSPTAMQAPTASTRPVCVTSITFVPWSRRSARRSTCSRCPPGPAWPSWRRPACGASRPAGRWPAPPMGRCWPPRTSCRRRERRHTPSATPRGRRSSTPSGRASGCGSRPRCCCRLNKGWSCASTTREQRSVFLARGHKRRLPFAPRAGTGHNGGRVAPTNQTEGTDAPFWARKARTMPCRTRARADSERGFSHLRVTSSVTQPLSPAPR